MSVLVRDGGVPALSATATVLCSVRDENDHSPEMIIPGHDIEVLDDQAPGLIYTVLASDLDAGNNGAVWYRIVGKCYLYLMPSPRLHPGIWINSVNTCFVASVLLFFVFFKKRVLFFPL